MIRHDKRKTTLQKHIKERPVLPAPGIQKASIVENHKKHRNPINGVTLKQGNYIAVFGFPQGQKGGKFYEY